MQKSLTPDLHLIVVAKSPVAGRVKTRLCPPYSLLEAAQLAEASLVDTLAAVAATPATARTIALAGSVGPWLPAGFSVVPQRGFGLDERLAAAFEDAERTLAAPMFLVGMDTPQVTPALLTRAAEALNTDGTDAVLGMSTDGGWWGLGLRRADRRLLAGVPMSTSHTGEDQLRRLLDSGLSVTMLPELTDVDDAASAALVADLVPDSRFAGSLRTLELAS